MVRVWVVRVQKQSPPKDPCTRIKGTKNDLAEIKIEINTISGVRISSFMYTRILPFVDAAAEAYIATLIRQRVTLPHLAYSTL